jgi:hypothetical protein
MKLKLNLQLGDRTIFRLILALAVLLAELISGFRK